MPSKAWLALMKMSPKVTPDQFEAIVKNAIQSMGMKLESFKVGAKRQMSVADGTYEIDVVAEFDALGGHYVVLIECKRYTKAVERKVVQELYGKLCSLGAQKGMVFSTSGFQKGAIQYAKHHGIAVAKVADGRVISLTKSLDDRIPSYRQGEAREVALLRPDVGSVSVLGPDNPRAILEWLAAPDLGVVGEPADDPALVVDSSEE